MADDLAAPPSSGGGEPVPAVDTGAVETPKAIPSLKDALSSAFEKVEAADNETNQAAAVLKEGPGADDKLKTDAKDALTEASEAERAAHEASERAKKGWETRRKNGEQEKAEASAAKVAETAAAKAVAEAAKKTETPAPAQTTESKFKAPPERFVPEAKADWEKVPETVRAEIDRSFKNLEQGIAKHKEGADRWAELGEFEQLAQQYYKKPLKDVLTNYVELDRLMHDKPLAAFERLASSMTYQDENGNTQNWTLKQLAQHILEQEGVERFDTPDIALQRELRDVKRELADLKKGWTERQTAEVTNQRMTLEQQIGEFAGKQDRWDELFPEVELLLTSPKFEPDLRGDPMARLKKAYEKAERINPKPSLSPPAPEIPAPDLEAQRRKGQASVAGAPGSGSSPAAKRPVPSTPREAVLAAARVHGLAT